MCNHVYTSDYSKSHGAMQEWAVTIDTLMQSILDESPNMIYFSGHGEHSGILLQDPIGNPTLVTNNA